MTRVPMTRFIAAACCALLPLSAWAQQRAKPGACTVRAADCQINVQAFNFGRGQMSANHGPINGHNTVSVTCIRTAGSGQRVDVRYDLLVLPAEPNRQMRDRDLGFLRYFLFVDPARTRYWGDGTSYGTFTFKGELSLDDQNRAATIVHQIYGQVDGAQIARPGQWLGLSPIRLEYSLSCQ